MTTAAEVIAFLKGAGPLEGNWWGERATGAPGYWWRHHLHLLTDPIPMVLHCPACGAQHIDAPTPEWDNPPHRSHLCGSCGCIWRPADVATVGVEAATTAGDADNWPLIKEASETDELEPLPLQAVEPEIEKAKRCGWCNYPEPAHSDLCRAYNRNR